MTDELIINIIVGLILIGAIFLIIRELVCWYWKINEGIDLQKKILAELVKSNNKPVELCDRVFIDNTGDRL